MIGLMVVLLTFFWKVRMVLLLWKVDVTLRNGYGIYGQNYVALLKINESQYIALFVVSGSIKKLSAIDSVNI